MRMALGIEYNGAEFYGWQRQLEVPSIQQHLERSISQVAATETRCFCAGRTDAGVHASGQVVHFNYEQPRPIKAWTLGVNAHLPKGISVRWAQEVSSEFHARFSATARRYRYIIENVSLRGAIFTAGISHYPAPLDAELMHSAAQLLVGEHDFSAFRAAQCQSLSPNRHLHFIHIWRQQDFIIVDIKANAFVHHMVRNIVGSLLWVGQGRKPSSWLQEVLLGKDRALAAPTASPNGLYLVEVDYPDHFQLPKQPLGPLFLLTP